MPPVTGHSYVPSIIKPCASSAKMGSSQEQLNAQRPSSIHPNHCITKKQVLPHNWGPRPWLRIRSSKPYERVAEAWSLEVEYATSCAYSRKGTSSKSHQWDSLANGTQWMPVCPDQTVRNSWGRRLFNPALSQEPAAWIAARCTLAVNIAHRLWYRDK